MKRQTRRAWTLSWCQRLMGRMWSWHHLCGKPEPEYPLMERLKPLLDGCDVDSDELSDETRDERGGGVGSGGGGRDGLRPDSEMKPDSSSKKGCFLGVWQWRRDSLAGLTMKRFISRLISILSGYKFEVWRPIRGNARRHPAVQPKNEPFTYNPAPIRLRSQVKFLLSSQNYFGASRPK